MTNEIEELIYSYKNKHLDIAYANESELQKMDIIQPDEMDGPLPVVFYIHGGSWVRGDKRSEGKLFTFEIPKYGYILVTINYRLAPDYIWPAQINDVEAAFNYIIDNAEKYNIDKEKIYLWGDSAGAHLAQYFTLTSNQNAPLSPIRGVISFYGVSDISCMDNDAKLHGVDMDFSTLGTMESPVCMLMGGIISEDESLLKKTKDASPINTIKENSVPFLIQHGKSDSTVSYYQSIRLAEKIAEVSPKTEVVLELIENAEHSDKKFKSIKNIERCIDFLDKYAYNGENPYR